MNFIPTVRIVNNAVRVEFSDAPHAGSARFECVLDIGDVGALIGIEILDFRRQLGGATVGSMRVTDDFRWSYDAEIDAFYLHVQRGSAQIQKKSVGIAYIDEQDRVAVLEVVMAAEWF